MDLRGRKRDENDVAIVPLSRIRSFLSTSHLISTILRAGITEREATGGAEDDEAEERRDEDDGTRVREPRKLSRVYGIYVQQLRTI